MLVGLKIACFCACVFGSTDSLFGCVSERSVLWKRMRMSQSQERWSLLLQYVEVS